MNRCPITYQECGTNTYSNEGLHLLSKKLQHPLVFPYSAEEQLQLAAAHATKLSIQGVQPKLSVKLNIKNHCFDIVDIRGTYIIKPPNPIFPELPENEDLTMRMARSIGIETPLHGLVYCKDETRSYFIKRFDRYGSGKKRAVEDFCQLLLLNRKTKYNSSMEQLVTVIDRFCTFPALEKQKLFRIVLFCFLSGNEDMHLKNFSLIKRAEKVELSPAYDLLNSTIVLRSKEELALPLAGKKSNLEKEYFINYYAKDRLGLQDKVIEKELQLLKNAFGKWEQLISISFLSEKMKDAYLELLYERKNRLSL